MSIPYKYYFPHNDSNSIRTNNSEPFHIFYGGISMKKSICLIFLGMIFIGSGMLHSQTGDYYFADSTYYSRAKVYLQDNVRYEVEDLMITNDRLSFINKINSKQSELDLTDVFVIKAFDGTEAAKYALYGGLISCLSGILAVASVETDPYEETSINKEAFVFGFAAAGAIIGAVVGANMEKWKTVYVSEKASIFNPNKYSFGFVGQRDYLGVNLRISL